MTSLASWGGGETESIWNVGPLFGLMYQPPMMDIDEYGAIGGILGRGDLSFRRKSATVKLCSPQIPNYITRVRTRVTTNRLTHSAASTTTTTTTTTTNDNNIQMPHKFLHPPRMYC
jgi:hypothetical protein